MSEHKEPSLLSKIREAGVTLQGGRTPFQRTQGNAIVTWCDEMRDKLEVFWDDALDYSDRNAFTFEETFKSNREAIWGGE